LAARTMCHVSQNVLLRIRLTEPLKFNHIW
jgi:hypothetical protein